MKPPFFRSEDDSFVGVSSVVHLSSCLVSPCNPVSGTLHELLAELNARNAAAANRRDAARMLTEVWRRMARGHGLCALSREFVGRGPEWWGV
jgi:hypothetical protein